LGAFEITPIEVLQVYTTMARFGSRVPLQMIKRIDGMDGETIYTPPVPTPFQILEKGDFGTINSILQEVMLTGTGASARARGLNIETAGKTGTTSNYKDAWFAGFSANHVAIVWTGYDDNTPIKLSGSSGALPIWTDYMLAMSNVLPQEPFNWPKENVTTLEVSTEELLRAGVPENKALPTKLYFYKK
jgi:penicillin-binding protein 1B